MSTNIATVGDMLKKYEGQIQQLIPSHLNIDRVTRLVEAHVDNQAIYDQLGLKKTDKRTPKMFIHEIFEKARRSAKPRP